MKSSYPRLRAIRPTRCNPILTVTTIREIAEHNGATFITSFSDERGYGVRFSYARWRVPSSPALRSRGYVMPPLAEGVTPGPFTYEEVRDSLIKHGVVGRA